MSIDYFNVITTESANLAAAVRNGPIGTMVPGCPDWNLAGLANHVGGVQRWSTYIVNTGEAPAPGFLQPVDDSEALAYFEAGTAPLVEALRAADLEAPAWNFTGGNLTKRFWLRRQALEVAAHRWDAESAIGVPNPFDPVVGADMIDEFVHSVIGRVLSRTKADTAALVGDVHLHCTDTEGEWTFQIVDGALQVSHGHGKAAAAVRGTASDLALFLYNRVSSDTLELFGDVGLVQAWTSILKF